MKYAACMVADQTFVYWADGWWTTEPSEARLYAFWSTAEHVPFADWVEEVPDEAEFRAGEPTW